MVYPLDHQSYDRIQAARYWVQLRKAFTDYFGELSYQFKPSMRVIDAKLVDPTTRFIGSHTSVLKPHIYAGTVPECGFCIIQPCFQAQNLELFYDDVAEIFDASLFECHGLLVSYNYLEQIVRHIAEYFSEKLSISNSIIYQVNSIDRDLLYIASAVLPQKNVTVDTLSLDKTRHYFGDERLSGRDIIIEMQSGESSVPCAAIIAIDVDSQPRYVEVAISPGRILQQHYGLDHYLDTFPLSGLPSKNTTLTKKMEDCIISVIFLCREGLKPGGSENKRQILKRYLKFLESSRAALEISYQQLECLLTSYEKAHYGDIQQAPQVIRYLFEIGSHRK